MKNSRSINTTAKPKCGAILGKRDRIWKQSSQKELLNDVPKPSLQQQNKLMPVNLEDKGQNTLISETRKHRKKNFHSQCKM